MPKLSVILMLAASAVCAAPVVSCRMGLEERGTFRIARDWLLVCGPGEETYDGIPRWTVEVVRESDNDDNRLSVPKVATSWEWWPQNGKVGLIYRTEDGKRHVLELRPDLSRLSFRPATVDGY